MSKKFTYLLGAGASAQKIPTVNDFGKALIELASYLGGIASQPGTKQDQKIILEEISNGFRWLSNHSRKFGTVDTYAKILFLKGDERLSAKLKALLTVFFLIRQRSDDSTKDWFSHGVDPRYLNFLASILDRAVFPENLKVLTWNYDFQFEIAARELMKDDSLVKNGDRAIRRRKPFIIEYYPTSGDRGFQGRYSYNLIHLNGIAGLNSETDEVISYLHDPSLYSLKRICEIFIELKVAKRTFIKFSWEYDSCLDHISEHLEQTEILVIIGYSFPFFNRKVDGELFERLKNLRTVYYQDTNLDINGQNLYDQFGLKRPAREIEGNHIISDPGVVIKMVRDSQKFFVPFEF